MLGFSTLVKKYKNYCCKFRTPSEFSCDMNFFFFFFALNINNGLSKWWNHRAVSHWPVNADSWYLPRDKKFWARALPRRSLHLWLWFAEAGPCHFCSLPSCPLLSQCLHTERWETVVCGYSLSKQRLRQRWWQPGVRSPPEQPVTGKKNIKKVDMYQKSRKKQRESSRNLSVFTSTVRVMVPNVVMGFSMVMLPVELSILNAPSSLPTAQTDGSAHLPELNIRTCSWLPTVLTAHYRVNYLLISSRVTVNGQNWIWFQR